MKITKIGHCCMLLEEGGVRLLTDPGIYAEGAVEGRTGITGIVITHDHADHYHLASLRAVLEKNPDATVVTNGTVGALLDAAGIPYVRVGDGESATIDDLEIKGFGTEHALVYGDLGKTENTGYLIAGKFYFPGDAFEVPGVPVDILALPVAGPWMKIAEAIDFAKAIAPRVAFGVHDAMVEPGSRGFAGMLIEQFVPGVQYVTLADGEARDF
ncbi:MAG TPA: MBL fold metallo-hydrolase [Candidatus Paceibacterota bacterium]|nr:MBL fold metallo-hydrolase [Candidatus Paceibacterota bacterium]